MNRPYSIIFLFATFMYCIFSLVVISTVKKIQKSFSDVAEENVPKFYEINQIYTIYYLFSLLFSIAAIAVSIFCAIKFSKLVFLYSFCWPICLIYSILGLIRNIKNRKTIKLLEDLIEAKELCQKRVEKLKREREELINNS